MLTITFQVTPNVNLSLQIAYAVRCSLVILVLYCVRIFTFTLSVGNCRGSFLVIDGKLTIPFQVTPSVNLSLQIAYAVRMLFGYSGFKPFFSIWLLYGCNIISAILKH